MKSPYNYKFCSCNDKNGANQLHEYSPPLQLCMVVSQTGIMNQSRQLSMFESLRISLARAEGKKTELAKQEGGATYYTQRQQAAKAGVA